MKAIKNFIFPALCGYILSCTLLLFIVGTDSVNSFYADKVSLFWTVAFALTFGGLSFALQRFLKLDARWQLALSIFIYANSVLWKMTNTSPFVGIVFIIAIALVVFRLCPDAKITVFESRKLRLGAIAVLSIAAGVMISYGTICRFKSYESSGFDMGIFTQMFEYMARTGRQLTTLERNELISHFSVHFSPCYYLILPIYMLFRDPTILLIVQTAIVISGVIPVYLLARGYDFNGIERVFACTVYIFFPAFCSALYFDFHENAFLPPLILWLLYFMLKKSRCAIIIMTLLLLTVKEDAGFYLVFIGIYGFFATRKTDGLIVTAMGAAGFVLTNIFINSYGEGAKYDRFDLYLTSSDDGLINIVGNVIKNPSFFADNLLSQEKLVFLLLVTLPFLFICFRCSKLCDIILIIPFIIMNLSTDYPHQFSIENQYVFGSATLLFFLFLNNVKDIKPRSKVLFICVLSTIILCNYATSDKYQLYTERNQNKSQIAITDHYLDKLDKSAVIYADTYLTPSMYDFENVYLLNTLEVNKADLLLIDNRKDNYLERIEEYSDRFEVSEQHGFITVMTPITNK